MRGLVVVMAPVALLACGSPHATTSVPHEPPHAATKLPVGPPLVTPGERMSYRVALGGMDLAVFDVAVGDITEVAGKRTIVVQSHARAAGLVKAVANIDDTFTSWIDVTSGRPVLWTVDEFETKGDRKEKTEVRFAERQGDQIPITFHLDEQPPQPEPQRASMPDAWDFNAFLVALRAWEAPAGTTVDLEVLRSRYMWNIKLTVAGKETLATELGPLPALRFDAHTYKLERNGSKDRDSDERDFSLWISDDDGRVPLQTTARTDYGDIKMQIVDYQPGIGQRLRP